MVRQVIEVVSVESPYDWAVFLIRSKKTWPKHYFWDVDERARIYIVDVCLGDVSWWVK